MKTATIKTPTAELLIVEAKDDNIAWAIVFQKYGAKAVTDYTLLGKPDEIKEEDAEKLFYNPIDSTNLTHYTNLRNLFSLIESEIFWENPIPTPEIQGGFDELGNFHGEYDDNWVSAFKESEQKTFDKNRTLIFKKNK